MICLLASSLGPSGGGVGKGIGSMKITFIPLTPSHMYLPCQWVTHFCPRTHSLLVLNQGQVHAVAYLSPNSLGCKCTHLTWFHASTGADPRIFYGGGGGSKLWFRMDCFGTFLWQITSSPHPLPPVAVAYYWPSCRQNCRPTEKAETTTCFSICERRSPLAWEILLCEKRWTDHRRVLKNNYTFEHPWNLV